MKTLSERLALGKPQVGEHLASIAGVRLLLLAGLLSQARGAVPRITSPPQDQTVVLHQQAAFGVMAGGTGPLLYQWRKDDVPITGATNDQIVLRHSQFDDAGQYSVVVSNPEGSVTSVDARLAVKAPRAGDLDFTFATGGLINGTVASVVVQADGKVLIGGDFSMVHGAVHGGVARLNPDGTTDCTFMNGLAGAGDTTPNYGYPSVRAVGVQPDGKVLIGGRFTSVNGVTRRSIARLNADGSLDDAFQTEIPPANNGGSDAGVSSIIVQADGKILVGGWFTSVNGISRTNIVRLNPDGTLDQSFRASIPEVGSGVRTAALQRDGKVLIGGGFGITRLNQDGGRDVDFEAVRVSEVFAVVIQRDDKVLIGGDFGAINGESRASIARLNADGTLDRSFSSAFEEPAGYVNAIAAPVDGRVLLGGQFMSVGGVSRTYLARLNADGTLDSSFQDGLSGADSAVNALAVQSDGRVIVVGCFAGLKDTVGSGIVRLKSDGSVDRGFQVEAAGSRYGFHALTVQADRKLLVGGPFDSVDGVRRNGMARLNSDGTLDTGLETTSVNGVNSMALQSDGKVVIGGWFQMVNGVPAASMARLWGTADIPPVIERLERNGPDVSLTWDAIPQRTYRVQYRQDLSDGPWKDLPGDITALGGTAHATDTVPAGSAQRFYRIVLFL